MQRLHNTLKVGDKIQVWYQESAPGQAVLEMGLDPRHWAMVVLLLLVALAMFSTALVKQNRRARVIPG
ncbi:DUF3592 domain-containing protein [Dongshaea marina]|uniref:DUF3592 domain-containing protein n=1 Tax=Dongshaea marina TaxID=2047966 RepID=UPI00131F0C42|nr:DUF3592 domain-containing protein [Dongshaea marina]